LYDQPVVVFLLRHEGGNLVFSQLPCLALILPSLGLLLQLSPQHRGGVRVLLQRFVQLGLRCRPDLLEFPGMPGFDRPELCLELREIVPLNIQSLLMLLGEPLLFRCRSEGKALTEK
jgi:hypothetical protein